MLVNPDFPLTHTLEAGELRIESYSTLDAFGVFFEKFNLITIPGLLQATSTPLESLRGDVKHYFL
jgi:hypothetical protein